MDKLSLQMSEAYFLPNQIIFNQENIDFNTLIFVIDGKIELTKQSQTEFGDQTVANISKNEVFGTFSFFTGQPGDLQAKALTFTSIVRVRRDVFQNIIKDHEKDQQQFNLIKDNLLLYNNYEQVNIACSVCQSFKHLTNECNLVHFDKFQFQKKLKFFEKVTQKRTFQNRLRKKALNTLSQINQINQNVQQFEQIHFLSFEEYSQNLTESSNQSDVEENQKQNDEQVQPHKNEPRQSILESLIREEKIARKSKTLADNDKNLKYLSLQNENAREKSSQFLPHQRASVLENLYEIQQAEGINSRTSLRIQKKRERNDQIRFKHDLVSSYQNINSYANVDTAFNIIKISQDNPWLFEKQKDYQFYFPEGNLKMVLIQHNRISKQKQKIFCKSQQKNEEYKTRHKFTKVHD